MIETQGVYPLSRAAVGPAKRDCQLNKAKQHQQNLSTLQRLLSTWSVLQPNACTAYEVTAAPARTGFLIPGRLVLETSSLGVGNIDHPIASKLLHGFTTSAGDDIKWGVAAAAAPLTVEISCICSSSFALSVRCPRAAATREKRARQCSKQ